MKVNFGPKTRFGNLSVGLIIIFFLFLAMLRFLVALGQSGGDTFFSNLTLAIPGLLMGISGVCAFFVGIVAIIKSKERSFFVFLATGAGFFVLIFLLGEILFPH